MNKKGFVPLILVLVIAGLLIAGGAWYYTTVSTPQNQSPSNSSTTSPTQVPPTNEVSNSTTNATNLGSTTANDTNNLSISISPNSGPAGSITTLTTSKVYCHCMSDRFATILFIRQGSSEPGVQPSKFYSDPTAPQWDEPPLWKNRLTTQTFQVPHALSAGVYEVTVTMDCGKGDCPAGPHTLYTVTSPNP